MRSMASGAAFHCAFLHATQQAFLEGHELAFAYYSGVFRKVRYDNLTSAVKKILRGHQREQTGRFIAFRSHWRFQSEFCTPGKGHEKGGVEGEVGYFRRNHWVPVPQAVDLASQGLVRTRNSKSAMEPSRRRNLSNKGRNCRSFSRKSAADSAPGAPVPSIHRMRPLPPKWGRKAARPNASRAGPARTGS